MIHQLLNWLGGLATQLIESMGYAGVFFGMLVESAGIPLPSEVIMPFAGYLVSLGKMNLWVVGVLGGVGNLVGSWLGYAVGYYGGKPLLEQYGKYVLISKSHIEEGEKWFNRHGEWAVFFGRLLPVVRTFISIPAGIAGMNLKRFSIYTLLGSLPWSFLFAWLGYVLGNNWETMEPYLRKGNWAVVGLLALLFIYLILKWSKRK